MSGLILTLLCVIKRFIQLDGFIKRVWIDTEPSYYHLTWNAPSYTEYKWPQQRI